MNPQLVALANRLGLSDARAAAYLGVPPSTWHKWLHGKRNPSAGANRLLYVLGVVETLAPNLHESFIPPLEGSQAGRARVATPKVPAPPDDAMRGLLDALREKLRDEYATGQDSRADEKDEE